MSVDDLASLYDGELTAIADQHVPYHAAVRRKRFSDPGFDCDCRVAKSELRRLEHKSLDAAKKSDAFAAAAARAARIDHRRTYRSLLRNKREAFWRPTIDSQHRSPRQLWSSIDSLLGRGSVSASESIGATDFHQFFDGNVAAVRSSTADAPSPTFTETDSVFNKLQPIKVDEVILVIHRLPDKQCSYELIPTSLLKVVAADVAPFFAQLFNQSLQTGIVPGSFKAACITPLIKKSDLDDADVKSHRKISNLSVSSKLLERLVARQLTDYLKHACSLCIDQAT
jgi:hypothetical protein